MDLLTIGDSSIDQFMKVEDSSATEERGAVCFFHGTKVPVDEFGTSIAGNALNVAVGTTKLGVKTFIYSEIGDDQNAQRIIQELKALGIETKFIIKNKGTLTDIHPIIIYKKDRTIFIYHEKRDYKIRNWEKPNWIYYSSIGKYFQDFQKELIKYLQANPSIGIAFNPGTFHLKAGAEAISDFLKVTHILFLNKEEAKQIVGAGSTEETHRKLQKLGPKVTVITDGENGASASDGNQLVNAPAYSEDTKPIVDKTGAGDAFSSGFLSAIISKRPLQEALMWGLVNSSGVIREVGAIHGLCTQDEITEKVKKLKCLSQL